MDKGLFVKDILPDQPASGLFIIRKSEARKTRAGGIYWSFLLVDASGEIEAKIWKPELCGLTTLPEEGSILEVESGMGGLYKNVRQLTIEKVRLLTEVETERLDQSWFRATSQKNAAEMWEELSALCEEEFQEPAWHDFVFSFFDDFELTAAFCSCPGAISVHHAYLGGLLEHTLSVFTLCRQFADHYPELDRKILLCGALFHDLGKIREYAYAVDISATDEGRLLGHLTMGVMLLEPFLQRAKISESCKMQIKHLILSHHGEPNYGACVEPMTQEAIALHFADNLDAKMAICRKQIAALQGLSHWTEAIYALDGRRLFVEKRPEKQETPCNGPKAPLSDKAATSTSENICHQTQTRTSQAKQTYEEKSMQPKQPLEGESKLKGTTASSLTQSLEEHGEGQAKALAAGPANAASVQGMAKPLEHEAPKQKNIQAQKNLDTSPKQEIMQGSELLETSYEGFHFCDDHALNNGPHEDLPLSVLTQWDEEELAKGEPEYGEAEDDLQSPKRAYAGKEATRKAVHVLPKLGESSVEVESKEQERQSSASPSQAHLTQVSADEGSPHNSLASHPLAALQNSSQADSQESLKTEKDPDSLDEKAKAAGASLASAFAADPELHFCDDELLNDTVSEDLPDFADITRLKEEIGAEQSLGGETERVYVEGLADQEVSKRDSSAKEVGGALKDELVIGSEMEPLQEETKTPETLHEADGPQFLAEQVASSQISDTQAHAQAGKDADEEKEPAKTVSDGKGYGEASELDGTGMKAQTTTPFTQSEQGTHRAPELPLWAQEAPKKKRVGRKKKTSDDSLSLFFS